MSFAVRKDGKGWRAVSGPEDIGEDEDFSDSEPVLISDNTQRIFTSLEFLELFTTEEQLAVVERTLTSAPIKLWYDRLLAAGYVDLEDPRTESGLSALVAADLITETRKNEILSIQ